MNFPKSTMYNLENDHACVIRNLLHNERLQYEYADHKGKDAAYYKTISEAIARMEQELEVLHSQMQKERDEVCLHAFKI